MNRRLLSTVFTLVAVAALGTFSSAALAGSAAPAKEKITPTKTPFTAEYTEGTEYFFEDTFHCMGVHKTNATYPGSGNHGGYDIEHCKLTRGQTFPARWQIVGDPINIDGNEWVSDYDHQGTFNFTSKVTSNHTFWIRAIYTP